MEEKVKFFNQTFKVLTAISVCAWILYFVLVFVVGDNCSMDASSLLFNVVAYATSFFAVLPIVYGLVRLIFWPYGPKNKVTYAVGWVVSGCVGLFIVAVTMFALAVAQFGCSY